MHLNLSNAQIKEQALQHLSNNWLKAALATLVVYLIIYMPGFSIDVEKYPAIPTFISLLLLPLSYGFYVLFLRLKRENIVSLNTLFVGFKEYFPILFTNLLLAIYTFLWTLLLIVPGIMKAYSYCMTNNLMADNPDLRYDAAIERSKKLMHGYRMQLFLLDLSMIGWFLLSLLTLGIGFLFLAPYIQTCHAEFYDQLLSERGEQTFEEIV